MSKSTSQPDMLALLSPRRVAVLGASDNPIKAGGRPIAYMRRHGFGGEIYPVNPARAQVQGIASYASLADLPQAPDVVVISLAGSEVEQAVAQCIEVGARGAVIYSSGFAELGEEGLRAQQALVTQARAAGLHLFGPNTQGVANFQQGAILNFSTMINECPPQDGPIAIVSQSGAGAAIVYGGMRRQGLGVRYLVATGNEADITVAQTVRGLMADEELRLVLMYAESLHDADVLAEAAALSARRDVPILAVKAGRTQAGQQTASSHTGAMASEDALSDAFLRQHNIVRLRDFDELVSYAQLFERRERPAGRKVAAISNSGATCVLAADAVEQNGLALAAFEPGQAQALRAVLPPYVAARNPIDMTTALLGQPAIYGAVLDTVAQSRAADSIFVGFPIGGEGYDMGYFAGQTAQFAAAAGVPVAVCAVQDWVATEFRQRGVPVFRSEFDAVRGLALLSDYAQRRGAVPVSCSQRGGVPQAAAAWNEPDSLAALARAGLPVMRHRVCRQRADIEAVFAELAAPLVLKGVSAAVTHKSDHGLVRLHVSDPAQGQAAWDDYAATLAGLGADFGGLLVAEQSRADFELAIGAHWDAAFGPVVMVGRGGVLVEAYQDMQFLVAPFTAAQARQAIGRLQVARGFAATRGLQAVDIDALAAMLVQLGDWFAGQAGRIVSVDANPVLVTRGAAPVLVDAVVIPAQEQ